MYDKQINKKQKGCSHMPGTSREILNKIFNRIRQLYLYRPREQYFDRSYVIILPV